VSFNDNYDFARPYLPVGGPNSGQAAMITQIHDGNGGQNKDAITPVDRTVSAVARPTSTLDLVSTRKT
jgi:hypothetical protein